MHCATLPGDLGAEVVKIHDEILLELGYDAARIDALHQSGVISEVLAFSIEFSLAHIFFGEGSILPPLKVCP